MKYRLQPYMSDDEVTYLEECVSNLPEYAVLTEWGSGGSTSMFLELMKPTQKLISIEHDPEWTNKISIALDDHPNRKNFLAINVQLQTIEMKDSRGTVNQIYYEEYKKYMIGMFLEENPCFLEHYINPTKLLDRVDEEMHSKLSILYDSDFYFVDGLARGAVLATIRVKAKKDAVVFIHDYAGRQNQYDWAVSLYSHKELVGKTLLKLTI